MTLRDRLTVDVPDEGPRPPHWRDGDRLLDAAVRIGDVLVAEAFRHQGRCSWMDATTDETATGLPVDLQVAIGPDLYGGTSGVALFLAELHAASGQASFRDTAAAAARHAIRAIDRPPKGDIGLYDGCVGIALALWRTGALLDDPGLAAHGLEALARLQVPDPGEREHDVISGTAGAVIGLVTLGCATGQDQLLERAQAFGVALLESGERRGGGVSWRCPGGGRTKNLTGYSHGAAGCGAALLELHAVDGGARWRDAALAAFAYEAHLYDAREGNWPDLRKVPRSASVHPGDVPGTALWCHGAPGIALSRLRAGEILGRGPWDDEATTALLTTWSTVQAALKGGTATWCLCHGVAGNAEILQLGSSHLLADRRAAELVEADLAGIARRTAGVGVDQFGLEPTTWPCGVRHGRSSGLLTGLAGIGRFLLRARDPDLPSVLSISPSTWA